MGGVVFYILQSGDKGYDPKIKHGLVVAIIDQTAEWGCYGSVITGADDYSIGSGKQNTSEILAGCKTRGIAARQCDELNLNGYSDWYLPSLNEMYLMLSRREVIKQAATSNGGQDLFGIYWTSTEANFTGLPESPGAMGGCYRFRLCLSCYN